MRTTSVRRREPRIARPTRAILIHCKQGNEGVIEEQIAGLNEAALW